ncbi:asparaginase [Halomonas sp. MCCC 1A11036]|uniref:Asparaginase n=1 Tax=Billgrantia zhangzhouensis TaxID=2733481 RepID=A0ABS9AAP3_9GAMM|nr:asparaginase [Halomonas zhangzhouensis]MCE8018939.1 asparaginase [Halomonas zhangzhouensis]
MTRSRIVVLATGGTIASQPDASGRNRSGALQGETLLAQVNLPATFSAQVEVHSILQKPSNAITCDDLLQLHETCQDIGAQEDVLGIVITHGTDTLEETAYFLDITLPHGKPVVLTGSQRAPHEPGTDAFCNIADALKVAATPQATGLGTLVVFNQSIFAARQVRKVSSFQLHGFASPETGPLGYVDGEQVHLAARPIRPAGYPLSVEGPLPRVDILPAYLGASPRLIEAAVESGATGLVIDGLGRGHAPPEWMEAIARVTARGIPVAVVSNCPSGPVHTSYEFTGSLASLQAAGAMPVTGLSARKARLALSVLLASPSARPLGERVKLLAA